MTTGTPAAARPSGSPTAPLTRPAAARRIAVSAPLALTVGCALLVVLLGRVGGDARWLGVLGRIVATTRRIPDGIPFADAPTAGWHNVPVLAELLLSGPQALGGDRGLLLVQALAVLTALLVLVRDARRAGAPDRATTAVLALVALAGCTSLLIVRLQLFSLVLLPLELLLLRAQTRRPTGQLWWLVPLLALWSNLHGAALLGLAVAIAYLLLERARQRPRESALVGLACAASLFLTPALAGTASYYLAALGNESARQHLGLWARLSWHSPFDVALVVVLLALLPAVRRSRPRLWEYAVLLGLAAATAQTARNGIWLLLALVVPAATGWSAGRPAAPSRPAPARGAAGVVSVLGVIGVVALAVTVLSLRHGRLDPPPLVAAAVTAAAGRPVAAEGVLSEQVVAAGGQVWVTNPLDAFSRADQHRFLTWSATGRTDLLPASAPVTLVNAGGPAARALARDGRFRLLRADRTCALYVRVPPG